MSEQGHRESIGRIEIAPEVLTTIAHYTTLDVEGVNKLAPVPADVSRLFRRAVRHDGILLNYTEGKLLFDIYVFMKDGAYLYDAAEHALMPAAAGDHRAEVTARPRGGPGGPPAAKPGAPPPAKPAGPPGGGSGAPPSQAPVQIFLVSDVARFRGGTEEQKLEWAAIDSGIVSQNISLFCAATGIGTRPRTGMNKDLIRSLLKLKDTQYPILNHPVGYLKVTS